MPPVGWWSRSRCTFVVVMSKRMTGGCDIAVGVSASCHTRPMADVLINRNNLRIDDDDMRGLITALDELGYTADVDPSTLVWATQPADWWVLVLRWLGEHPGDVAALGSLVVLLAEKVRGVFRNRQKPPPNQVWLYGPDGRTIISRVEVPEDDEAGAQRRSRRTAT